MPHPVPDGVDLTACLFGGQAFTWWKEEAGFAGLVRGTLVRIDADAGTWTSTPERPAGFLEEYLGASRTQPADLLHDPTLRPLAQALGGLRLLSQEPWEGLMAFMISPVNNVPRIQETISRLCRALGPELGDAGMHAVPGPQAVARAGAARLRELGLGFRAPRLHAAAVEVHQGTLDLQALQTSEVQQARERLLRLDGVGPKVGECILCYALAFEDAFPVDRWVERACGALFDGRLEPDDARERWGQQAAMAQQLLFHGARMGLIDGVEASPVSGFDRWRALAP